MKKLTPVLIIAVLAASASAATTYVDANGTGDYPTIHAAINDAYDGDTVLIADGNYTGAGNRDIYITEPSYAADEILIKFRKQAANRVRESLQSGIPPEDISLAGSLDKFKNEFRVYHMEPVFRDFERIRTFHEQLTKKEANQLDEAELRLLKRRKRAPKNAQVPELGRIYRCKIELKGDKTLQQLVNACNCDPEVEYAELNYIVTVDAIPNDPYFAYQWPLNNIGQMYPPGGGYNDPPGTPDADIDVPEAWDIHIGSPDIIVAVADTGVYYYHRDIHDSMWTGPSGHHGYDFVHSDNYPLDDHGHGTHCAGIIAAETNNGLDIAGVCWNVRIMALKCLDENGEGYYADAADAFYYAVNQGAEVISNSWGGDDFSQTLQDAIDYAHSQGVIIVAAAGNDNQYYFPHYPASMEHVISVAATNSNDQRAPFSNYGTRINISAPGVDILSLRAPGTSMGTVYDSYNTIASGTSMACPYVSGVLGLILSAYPSASTEEVTARLLETADNISEQNPYYEDLLGSGRVNAHRAIRPNFEGIIKLSQEYYSCSDDVEIEVRDFDVRESGSQQVRVTTDGGDSETVILVEDANRPWIFMGTITTSDAPIVAEDGYLQVLHGQTITAGYNDPNYGDVGPSQVETTAVVDCEEALIFDVSVHNMTSSGAWVSFKTDEPTTGWIRCGLACGGPYDIVGEDKAFRVIHDIYLSGLNSQKDYYFVIDANDVSGNQTTNTNSGQCYTFSTTQIPEGLHVPDQYPTIQAAINSSESGDTIWVADGTYTGPGNRNIHFAGRSITVRSENGPEHCVIDCEKTCRAFTFDAGEDPNAVIIGFTVQNGYAGGAAWKDAIGGAILCYNSSPTINNCVFTGNDAISYGGAILLGDLMQFSNSVIRNCIFVGNSAHFGGGIHCGKGNQTLTNCKFIGNVATYDYGGGICCWQDSYAIIENCLIKNNASFRTGRGGGIGCVLAYPTMDNCLFVDNFGGPAVYSIHTKANVINCTFYGNANWGCVFGGNKDVYVKNCILFNNYPNQIYKGMTTGKVYVSYSDVQGGYLGTGNIKSDPCFTDPANDDFHLCRFSPCINTGDPSYVLEPDETDLDGKPRVIGGRIDMGAYEFNHQPVAKAGPNHVVYAEFIDGLADVNLDGSASYDDDNDVLNYYWSWAIDSNLCQANGVSPCITLPVGEHQIELVVDDGIDESQPDYCTITVIGPLKASLSLWPSIINPNARPLRILVLMQLPRDIEPQDVSNQPLTMYPGQIQSKYQYVYKMGYGRHARTMVIAVFNRNDICSTLGTEGRHQVKIAGQLKTGRYFFGADTITIVSPKPYPWPFHRFYHRH